MPPAVGAQSLNHWTAWEVPPHKYLLSAYNVPSNPKYWGLGTSVVKTDKNPYLYGAYVLAGVDRQ